MKSISTELRTDSLDGGSPNFDDPDSGFELDKLEIPKPPVKAEPTSVADSILKKDTQGTPLSKSATESESSKKTEPLSKPDRFTKSIFLLVISVGLSATLGVVGFVTIKLIQPNPTTAPSGHAPVGSYHVIEPIVTNLDDNGYVSIALMLRFRSQEKAQFLTFKSKGIDAVFRFLGSDDFKRSIARGGSANMKSVLYNEITRFLEVSYPEQAILSEIRLTPRAPS